MKAKINQKTLQITFTGIRSEGDLDDVVCYVEKAGCTYKQYDCATKVIVTAPDLKSLKKYISLFNK